MKNNRRIKITALTLALAATLASCGTQTDNSSVKSSETENINSSESSAESSTEISSEKETETEEKTETEASSENTESVSESSEMTDSETKTENEPLYTYDNNMKTYDFKVTEDGSYTFKHSGNDDVPWNIYILDEKFTDGIRYLYSNYTPDGITEFTVRLKSGQYVYLICTENEWTDSADDFADTSVSVYKNRE